MKPVAGGQTSVRALELLTAYCGSCYRDYGDSGAMKEGTLYAGPMLRDRFCLFVLNPAVLRTYPLAKPAGSIVSDHAAL